jgi:glycosyltransferase involved in cell wall biosynthesis
MNSISVLIPVLNEERHLPRTASAMLAQRGQLDIEFLFIDGGSTDATRAILAELAKSDPRVRVLENPRRRVAAALNVGLRAARGELIARMDAHTFYPAEYLARAAARLERGDVAWVSGPQLALGEGRWSQRVARAMHSRLGVGGASFRRVPEAEIETDTGYTGVWRRETLERLGGWDEAAVVNEDGELAARVRDAGGRIVCLPELAAWCATRDSLGALAAQYRRYGTYRVRTLGLHPDSIRRSHLLPPLLVATTAAVALPGAAGRAARRALAVYLAALAVEGARHGHGPVDALGVAAVHATMHSSWGIGFIVGCARFGLPVAALRAALSPRPRGR